MLKLLPELFPEVLIPGAVRDEIMAGPADDAMRRALTESNWLRTIVLDPPLSGLATMHLGKGEAEVIECAIRQAKPHAVLVDDRAGRRSAQALGLTVIGTLSVVAAACKVGHLSSFDEAADRLKFAGLYLSSALVETIRKNLENK